MSISISIDQTQANAGKESLSALITREGTNPFQTSTIPTEDDALQAGLGPLMPEADVLIKHAFNHESRPLPVAFRNLPVSCTDWPTSNHHEVAIQSGGVWPTLTQDVIDWAKERLPLDRQRWKAAGIYDLILLSLNLCPTGGNRCVLMPLICFWNPSANVFDFRFGQATVTLLDMYADLGFPLGEKPYHEPDYNDLPKIPYAKFTPAWVTFVKRFRLSAIYPAQDPGESAYAKGVAFLDYWLNKFIFCSTAGKMTKTYHRMAEVLYARQEIGLGQIVLAHLYRCLHILSCNPLHSKVPGPLWILEAWYRMYFPLLGPKHHQKPKNPDAFVLASQYVGTVMNKDIGYYDCLRVIFEPKAPEFYPAARTILEHKYPRALRDGFMPSVAQSDEGRRLFIQCTSMADFPLFSSSQREKGFEVYALQLFARQLGLTQLAPYPPLQSVNMFSAWRAGKEAVSSLKHSEYPLLRDDFPLEISAEVDPGYLLWWQIFRGEYFEDSRALEYFQILFKDQRQFVTSEDRQYLQTEQERMVLLHNHSYVKAFVDYMAMINQLSLYRRLVIETISPRANHQPTPRRERKQRMRHRQPLRKRAEFRWLLIQ